MTAGIKAIRLRARGRDAALVAGAVVSILLHALLLIAPQGRAPVDLSISEARRPSSVKLTLRPGDAWKDDGQAEAKRARRAHAAKKLARKPAAPGVHGETSSDSIDEKPALPAVDLEAARKIAIETDRARERSLSELAALDSPAPSSKARLSRDIAKAVRPDCATAHAGKGLFAVIFLLKNAITDEGCRW